MKEGQRAMQVPWTSPLQDVDNIRKRELITVEYFLNWWHLMMKLKSKSYIIASTVGHVMLILCEETRLAFSSLSGVVFMQVIDWTTSCPFICWSIGSNPPIEIGREFTRIIIHYLCPFLVRPICPFLSILCLFCFHGRSTNNLLIHIHVPVYQIINPKSRKIAREVDLEFNPS